ncbi:MAG: hypothetical protein HQK96_07045 [Nitrospirae bacterium]|nr:hypothetical protein [Nitrospirota bacterium]
MQGILPDAKIACVCLWAVLLFSSFAFAGDVDLNKVISCNNCTYENKDNILSIQYKGDVEAADNLRKLQALGYVAGGVSYEAMVRIHFNHVAKDELLFNITFNSIEINRNTSRYLSFAFILQNDVELSSYQVSDSQIEQISGGNKSISFKLPTKGSSADTLVLRFFGITNMKILRLTVD